jgi:Flp pilus assembly protein TadB
MSDRVDAWEMVADGRYLKPPMKAKERKEDVHSKRAKKVGAYQALIEKEKQRAQREESEVDEESEKTQESEPKSDVDSEPAFIALALGFVVATLVTGVVKAFEKQK